MKRDVESLKNDSFDLVVVGGGVYGAWTAYTAALSGIKTALIDRGDWACGTSSVCSRLIHGGLRYLEQFRLGLVKSSLNERKLLARIAPHRVRPLTFVMPVYRGNRAGRARLKAGLWLYDFLAGKNQPVDPHRFFSPDKTAVLYPGLATDGLTGTFTYGDCITDDARYTLELVSGVLTAGGKAANYVNAVSVLNNGKKVVGIAAENVTNGEAFDIRARVVVNATGPWAASAMGGEISPGPVKLVKGVHLVLPALPSADALLGFSGRDKRVLFVIPWYGRTLLGTTDTVISGDPGDVSVQSDDIDYLLGEAARVIPGTGWDRSAIIAGFAGVRILGDIPGRAPESLSREWWLESPRPGVLVSGGGKFTTARPDAGVIVSRVLRMLGRPSGDLADTGKRCFPWCPADATSSNRDNPVPATGGAEGLGDDIIRSVSGRYGSRSPGVFALVNNRPDLGKRIVPDLPFIEAEVLYGATDEMVLTLEDVLRRRLPLLILEPPDRTLLEHLAGLVAETRGWTPERVGREVDTVLEKYGSSFR